MRKRLFYILSWTLVGLSLPLLGLAVICDKLGLLRARDAIADAFLAFLAWCMLRLSGSTVYIEGLEQIPASGPVVFISNHQGHFDSAVFLAYIRKPKGFVATQEAAKIPILKTWFNFISTIYLEKDNLRQNYAALLGAVEVIRGGRSMVIYPEGVISSSPQQGEFKKGAFKLAFNTGVPIVPVVIDGTWKIMGQHNDTIQSAKIFLRVLPAIPTAGLDRLEQQKIPARIFQLIEENLAEIRAG